MTDIPDRIWCWLDCDQDYELEGEWSEKETLSSHQYVRADLIDELVAALEKTEKWLHNDYHIRSSNKTYVEGNWYAITDEIKAAIAKAKGTET